MLIKFTTFALVSILGASSISKSAPKQKENIITPEENTVIIPEDPIKPSWKCPDCTPNEKIVLTALQEHTRISDRNALATIMGNIQQESKFIANICEGGARVTYENCLSGGYGLIQWTSIFISICIINFVLLYET